MFTLGSLLVPTAWFGPFALAALLRLAERRWPRWRSSEDALATAKFGLGALTLCTLVFCILALQEPIVAAAFPLRVVDVSALPAPIAVIFAVSFLLIDLAAWVSHWIMHRLGFLWSLHKVHHADESVSASTALLHHPLEAAINWAFMLSVYVTFGIPLGAVLLYAACAALHSALSHSNIALPKWLNTVLSPVMILPDVHRIHHSIVGRESHSNYGQLFPFWDRLFGVYVNAPREGIRDFRMGVEGEKISSDRPIKAMLKMPWIKGRPGSGEMTET